MVVLDVGLEMLGQVGDALGEHGHLDFGRSRIAFASWRYSVITSFLRSVVIVICRSSSSKVENTERSQLAFCELGQRNRLALCCREKTVSP